MKNLTISLHEDLIVEILLRLPVRSLVRFKCVCKSWRSLICSSQFGKSHFDLAAAPSNRFLISKIYHLVDSIDLSDDSVVSFCLPAHPLTSCRTVIWGSCRGFVLLHYTRLSSVSDLIVWNPSTGEYKPVPHSGDVNCRYTYGFGYDALTDDYLVICINCNENKTHFTLFSVKTNSWNYLRDPYDGKKLYPSKPGLLLNGALHWLAYSSSGTVIVAFDLGQRTLSEIPLPLDTAVPSDIYLHTIGGCLGCLGCPSLSCWFTERSEVWVMKEYKVLSSWTRVFSSTVRINEGRWFESNLFPPRLEEISDKTFESNFCCLSIIDHYYGRNHFWRRSLTINKQGLCKHLASGGGLVLFGYTLSPAMYRESLLSLPEKQTRITNINRQGKLRYALPY